MNDKDQARLNLMKLFPKQDFGLTERQDRLLALIACTDGNSMSEAGIRKFIAYSTTVKFETDIAVLKADHGYIERTSYWTRTFSVCDRNFMRVALNAVLYYPELVKDLRAARHLGTSDRFSLVQNLAGGTEVKIPKGILWKDSSELSLIFGDVACEAAFEPVIEGLPQVAIEQIADENLDELSETNAVDAEHLDAIGRLAERRLSGDSLLRVQAKLDGFRFFLDGGLRHADERAVKLSEWPAATAAVSALYGGDYAKAGELFEAALKIRNRRAQLKNIFESPILAYFLMLSYILSDTDKTRKKIEQYLNKKMDGWWFEEAQKPAVILGNLNQGASDGYVGSLIRAAAAGSDITARILSGGIAASRNLQFPETLALSAFSVVRHELGTGDRAEDARLDSLFGGSSLLSRIRVKKPWEMALEKLGALVDKGKPASAASGVEQAKERRIIYLVGRYDEISMREQNILKSGHWSAGKRVSFSSFCEDMYNDVFDDFDRAVQSRIRRTGDNSAASLFPVLVGCDRVYFDSYEPANRVDICEELPYVEVKLSAGAYEFRANVLRARYEREYSLENVYKRDKFHYTVIRLSRIQSQILLSIAENRVRFPEESKDALTAFIRRLSSVIEVHSPLLESGSSLEERKGSTMLWLRIIPKSGHFDALLYVRPLENGKLTFFPGKGEAVCYDSDGAVRYQVTRSLRDENSALKTFLETTGLDGIGQTDGLYELSPEEMLPVVDAARGLGDICTLEWPEGRSVRVRGTLEPGAISINVRSKEQWFEIEGNAELPDGDALALEQILSAIAAGGYGNGYLKLGEDDYVALSDSLAKYLKRLESVTQSSRGSERVSLFQVGALADIVRRGHLNAETDAEYGERLARIDESASFNPPVPAALKAELRDYQEEGFRWMARLDHWGAGACLADDMGLGKTVQTIAFLLYKAKSGASLVVAPASVLMNWTRELARFAPSLNVVVLNEQDDRTDALKGIGEYDVVLTTYGLLVREKEALSSVQWNVVCLDEAHTIKNRGTKMSDAAMSLKASSRVILTGTPVQNYLGELWNLFQFLNPGLLGSYESFHQKFIAPIENSEDKDRQSQLKRIIQPFMLRRTKSEVIEELPEKTEIYRSVPMSAAETLAYEAMRLEAKNELEQDTRVNMNALAAITRLREAACAMPLVKDGWSGEPTKLAALRELVGEIVSGGNSVLVFSQFTGFLDIVSRALDEDGVSHFYLQGSTPIRKRQEMVSGFQRAERPVFLISLKAGGLGLNLTGANYVIHLDPWWNPAIEQQATDRAYRIGQQQNVTVYHLIAQNSIEEKILRLHRSKQNLADAILEGTSKSHAITLDELRELLQ